MKIIVRRTEIPKIAKPKIQEMYPEYTFVGTPFGYFYPVAETKTVFCDYGFNDLVKIVQLHYSANGIREPDSLVRLMNEHICHHVPDICAEADPQRERKITLWHLAQRCYNAIKSAVTKGLVPQDEAERRAVICAGCPNNGPAEALTCVGCWTAKFVKESAEALSHRHSALDDRLDTCSLCQCSTKLKIHVKREGMEEKGVKWPEWCWMIKGN